MTLFSSRRERRLWACALAVLVAIYLTFGLAQTLVGLLGDSGLDVWLFLFACILILVTVVTQGLRVWPSMAEVGAAIGIYAAYLLVFVRMTIPTERSHLVEYGVVAICVYEALRERASQGRRVPVPALLAVLITGLLGVLDECVQLAMPDRVFDPVDMYFNVVAGAMAVAASASLAAARRWAVARTRGRRGSPPTTQ